MKFGDKLIVLRKKNGMSQEELAEKLNVSRQSVSKWESNNTYPETDKIVQIANLFDCSMDDLINDKITDIDQTLRKNKNSLNEAWDSLLDFITRTVNMFSHMKFSTGLKCVIEMIIAAFILWLIGLTVCGISSHVISGMFNFLGNNISNIIENILRGILNVLWFIITVIILIHTFKIRYLNYYELDKQEDEKNKDNNKKDFTNKREKVIIRDEKDKPFAFLSVLSNVVLFFIKFIVVLIAISLIGLIIPSVIASVVTLSFIPTNILFLGITISLIAGIAILILFLLLCIYFIFNKKINFKLLLITFISAILLCGIGIGISTVSLKNIEIIDDNKDTQEEQLQLDYKDNSIIKTYSTNNYKYIMDNNMEDNKIIVKANINKDIKKLATHNSSEDNIEVVYITGDFTKDNKDYYDLIIKDLKHNKIHTTYVNDNINDIVIVANENTINKLIANLEKLYLIEKNYKDNNIDINIKESKVHFTNGFYGKYNAITDELIYDSDVDSNYKCNKTIQNTKYGDKILYDCKIIEEDYTE